MTPAGGRKRGTGARGASFAAACAPAGSGWRSCVAVSRRQPRGRRRSYPSMWRAYRSCVSPALEPARLWAAPHWSAAPAHAAPRGGERPRATMTPPKPTPAASTWCRSSLPPAGMTNRTRLRNSGPSRTAASSPPETALSAGLRSVPTTSSATLAASPSPSWRRSPRTVPRPRVCSRPKTTPTSSRATLGRSRPASARSARSRRQLAPPESSPGRRGLPCRP